MNAQTNRLLRATYPIVCSDYDAKGHGWQKRRVEKRRECMMLVQLKRELNNAQKDASLFVLLPFFLFFPLILKFFWSVLPFDSDAEKISLNCQEQRERTSEKHPGKAPTKACTHKRPPPWVLYSCI